MHPPFFIVDHKIGPDILHQADSKPVVRRDLPERLALNPSAAGWPPPQRKLRNVIGRFLIRAGHRMIMENRV